MYTTRYHGGSRSPDFRREACRQTLSQHVFEKNFLLIWDYQGYKIRRRGLVCKYPEILFPDRADLVPWAQYILSQEFCYEP